MATVTINTGTSYQTFNGWEATAQTGHTHYIVTHTNYTDEVLDQAVELGINRLRVEMQSGVIENSTDYYGLFLANNEDFVDNNTPVEYKNWRDNRYIPVNDNGDSNSINASGFHFDQIDHTIDKIVIPMKTKLAVQGESLFWSLCYIHFSASNQLHIDTAAEYGEMILAVWQHLDTTYGFVPDALEIFLEPDNTAAVTGAELAAMIIAARDRLINAGFAKPYIIAPSSTQAVNGRALYLDIKTANATAAGYIDEISYHRYLDMDSTNYAALLTTANADSKNTSMIEWIGADYTNLYKDLDEAHVSAWQQFTLAFHSGGTDDGSKLFEITNGTWVVAPYSRTKLLRQYFKFIRRNAVMKGVTNSSSNYKGLPFQNANGTYVVPIMCTTSGDIDVVGLPPGTYGIKYSTASSYDVDLSNQVVTTTENVSFTMPAAGVVTVYDITFMDNGTFYYFGQVPAIG